MKGCHLLSPSGRCMPHFDAGEQRPSSSIPLTALLQMSHRTLGLVAQLLLSIRRSTRLIKNDTTCCFVLTVVSAYFVTDCTARLGKCQGKITLHISKVK